MSFADLGLCEPILNAVKSEGYEVPTPIQSEAIPHVLAGRDLFGCAQTGTGKTAAFALPIIHRLMESGVVSTKVRRPIRALILAPTRELAIQIADCILAYSKHTDIRHTLVFGGVSQVPQVRALQRGIDIVVATPGRLCDLMAQGHVDLSHVETFVLDEADRMLDMGFAPQLNRIVEQVPRYRQTLLFSATMPPEVEALARKYLRKPVVVQVGRRSSAATTVTHAVYPVPRHLKNDLLVHLLTKKAHDSVLVFTRTKSGADRVVQDLEKAGVKAGAMHADKSQRERMAALEDFKSGKLRVLVATDIAQRGLDISGITHVINYDVPQQPEDYVHRIGRTGRAASTGDAYTFMAAEDIGMVRTIERTIGQEIPRVSVPGFDFGT